MEILQKNEYHTDDPYIKELINEQIRREIAVNLSQGDPQQSKQKKGKSSHEQNLLNLKNNDNKFKYLWGDNEDAEEVDYQDEERRKRDHEMQLVEPPRFKVIGYVQDKTSRLRRKPIMRMSDLYLTNNPRVRRIINRIFERQIYGRQEPRKEEEGHVIIAKTTSNAAQLEEILKTYENRDEDYGFEDAQLQMDEAQLEQYIIDRSQSKQNYFLFYKHEKPMQNNYQVKNNPLNSQHFLRRLHHEVKQMENRYHQPEQEQENEEGEPNKRQEGKRVKQYFGQFRPSSKKHNGPHLRIEDNFDARTKATDTVISQILDYYSYVDNEILQEKYKLSLQANDRLELNLSNPYFFQPKLHTILHREREFMQESEYNAKLAEANKNNPKMGDKSLVSAEHGLGGRSKLLSGLQGEARDLMEGTEEEQTTIEKVIEVEIKNVYKQPLKHSELATKFEFVKFTLEQDCFNLYHRSSFPFHDHLANGKVRIELAPHRPRKTKPNGLVLNAQMKQSNQKFSRREDLSLAKGEFILVEYIEQTPLLMSSIGMCERMFLQVNYLQILQRLKIEIINSKSFEEMEEERDRKRTQADMTYQRHCELWRKIILEIFGENGKQFYWQPKNNGKLIGIPDGPGVALLENNLFNMPIVKKKPNTRDFLLVRQGKRWVIRRIDNLYVGGQVEPHKKVFCPGSRQHTEFKLAYEKAYIVKQIREYGSVNFDQLKLTFKLETENSLRKALKNANAVSKDSKNYRLASDPPPSGQNDLTPQDVCLYQRMQKSLCELKQVGISDIRSNQKMKNVLKQFNRKHFNTPERIAIARMIREQLQLTSWYLTDSFLKYRQKASKIEINGFADPTRGRGGYSYINKPQKERTSKEDMEEKAEKQKTFQVSDLRKLNCNSSRELLRSMGHNEDEIDVKSRWQLIKELKNKEGTEFSRRERETKNKKIENEKKEISKNFNRLLAYLHDQTEEPAFDYARQKRNKLEDYMQREREYIEKIKRKFGRGDLASVKEEPKSDDSDEDD